MSAGEALAKREIDADAALHPAAAALFRGLLVKRMEELGIGRPSTYASILQVLKDRDYVRHRQEAPRPRGQGPRW